eukprot:2497038-Rhodomonas_salina.3
MVPSSSSAGKTPVENEACQEEDALRFSLCKGTWGCLRIVSRVSQGLGSRVEGLGSRDMGLGSGVQGLGSRIQRLGSRVSGPETRVQGLGSRGLEGGVLAEKKGALRKRKGLYRKGVHAAPLTWRAAVRPPDAVEQRVLCTCGAYRLGHVAKQQYWYACARSRLALPPTHVTYAARSRRRTLSPGSRHVCAWVTSRMLLGHVTGPEETRRAWTRNSMAMPMMLFSTLPHVSTAVSHVAGTSVPDCW